MPRTWSSPHRAVARSASTSSWNATSSRPPCASGRPPRCACTISGTAASLLIREGAPIKALQRQLGHQDAVQTLNRYGHLYPDELDSLAERLEQVRERARAEARTAPMRLDSAPVVVQIAKAAGQ
jgi:integrase